MYIEWVGAGQTNAAGESWRRPVPQMTMFENLSKIKNRMVGNEEPKTGYQIHRVT